MHDLDELHGHVTMSEEERLQLAESIWRQENVELKTVGIDIGSSTSHLLFAKIGLQRKTQGHSSRFVVINREVVWRSSIILTPFLKDGTIDTHALDHFIRHSYYHAGLKRSDIDSGAVILTGEAIKRKNARAIDELFAGEAGKFVCATAGHKLESTLAAHGSGAVKLSQQLGICLLHVDIGGGTTKLALISKGTILSVAAFAVGGRLIATDAAGAWTRVEDSAQLVAQDLQLSTDPAELADPEVRRRIARRLASIAVDYILNRPLDEIGAALQLTEPLNLAAAPAAISFSGGVSEYIYGREQKDFGDIAEMLATELRQQLIDLPALQVLDPGQGIRATVIGASQFTVQVSGKTIYLRDASLLPVHNVPVVHVNTNLSGQIDPHQFAHAIQHRIKHMDLTHDAAMAIAFRWAGDPEYRRLEATARGILLATAPELRRQNPLLLMIDGDVGRTLGRLLHEELGLSGPLVSIDGVRLQDLDYVDVGELISPPGVVPLVIKSLLFAAPAMARLASAD